jgi:hypothetical protein
MELGPNARLGDLELRPAAAYVRRLSLEFELVDTLDVSESLLREILDYITAFEQWPARDLVWCQKSADVVTRQSTGGNLAWDATSAVSGLEQAVLVTS